MGHRGHFAFVSHIPPSSVILVLDGGRSKFAISRASQNISGFRYSTLQSSNDENNISSPTEIKNEEHSDKQGIRSRLRQSVTKASRKVQRLVAGGSSTVVSKGGSPIAGVLTDAAVNAANMAKEEVRTAARDVIQRAYGGIGVNKDTEHDIETQARIEGDTQIAMDAISLAKTTVADEFEAAESAIRLAEEELQRAKMELEAARRDAALGLAAAEKAASDAARKARRATDHAWVEQLKAGTDETEFVDEIDENMDSPIKADNSTIFSGENDMSGEISSLNSETQEQRDNATVETDEEFDNPAIIADVWSDFDISSLRYEDVDYTLTDMAPPFINEDECLIPGEPVVRVEKAPQNSRRIFAGIDIPVSVDDVWNLLTDYENLQNVVPNLVVNEVLELLPGSPSPQTHLHALDPNLSHAEQCRAIAQNMKGAILKQVGGAKVVGINFSARTTLEVREWPQGMPDFAHFEEEVYEGKSRSARVRESKGRELERYVFPRPFALSSLPHKDISMQSVEKDDGEFRMYQGVWRMQPLPGCSPPGESAMRLTYAVEVSPRPYLPVALVEGRIAQDLCANLKAIRASFMGRD